jgi:hypothetical protein
VAWYLCTLSSGSKNWELCKRFNLWGINTSSGFASSDRARKKDFLLFWRAGIGYVARAEVVEDSRPPISEVEAPWLGGTQRYGLIVPFSHLQEFPSPVLLRFQNNKQELTLLNQSAFQRGFIPINDSVAEKVLSQVGCK